MRTVAVVGRRVAELQPGNASIRTVALEGIPVTVGLIETADPVWDGGAVRVLVRKRAFSLNFRDKRSIFLAAVRGANNGFFPVGSEFVGDVVESPSGRFAPGDRVLPDHNYTRPVGPGIPSGVVSTHASRELEIFDESRLLKVPEEMSDEEAAAFSIGAQTAYSMVRKLDVQPGENILVTAAHSNTSLFVFQALRGCGVNVYAMASSPRCESRLHAMGVREMVRPADLPALARRVGGFRGVIDPYFDLYVEIAVAAMAFGGKYITCGILDQYPEVVSGGAAPPRIPAAALILHNLQLIGNCLGTTADLERALEDYRRGTLDVPIDSVFTGDEVGAFFERTFAAPDRFGKVVYRYSRR